jgi:hypothetical protein
VDETSRELFSAILEEIQVMKRENRILREAMENIRLQINGLTRDILTIASAFGFTLPRRGTEGPGDERC